HQRENYPYLLADELPEFLSLVDKYQGSQIVRTALNILMLTGLRPGELRKSEWSFIDFESRTWKLPEKIMKMGRVHVVPMSDQVISLL
ncbi:tyrosine-type recombinase/integrase, partial [Proteus mirabilis]